MRNAIPQFRAVTAAGVCVREGMGAGAAAVLTDDDKGQKPDAGCYQAPSISEIHTHMQTL